MTCIFTDLRTSQIIEIHDCADENEVMQYAAELSAERGIPLDEIYIQDL